MNFNDFKKIVPNTSDKEKILALKKASIIHAFLNTNPEYVQRNELGIWVYGKHKKVLDDTQWKNMFAYVG